MTFCPVSTFEMTWHDVFVPQVLLLESAKRQTSRKKPRPAKQGKDKEVFETVLCICEIGHFRGKDAKSSWKLKLNDDLSVGS